MQNIGLRKHSKNIEKDLPCGKAYVNLCPEESNVIFRIPLIEDMGISYVFNSRCFSQMGTMGSGANVSIFKKLQGTQITNADFSVDNYNYDEENEETGLTLSRINYDSVYGFELRDKNNNVYRYNRQSDNRFPCEQVCEGGDTAYIEEHIDSIIVTFKFREAVLYKNDSGLINRIEYRHDDTLIQTVFLTYSNNFLTKIEYKSPRSGSNFLAIRKHLGHGVGGRPLILLSVTSTASQNGAEFVLDAPTQTIKEIHNIIGGHSQLDSTIAFDNDNEITTVTDDSGVKQFFFFEKKTVREKDYYVNSLTMTDAGDVSCVEYNDSFAPTYTFEYDGLTQEDAIIENESLSYFSASGRQYNSNEIENFQVVDNAMIVSGLNVSKNLNLRLNGTDSVVFTCLVKSTGEPCNITASINSVSTTIKATESWKMLVAKLDVEEAIDYVTLAVSTQGTVAIGSFNLFKNSFANFFQYDSDGNNNGNGSIEYEGGKVSSLIASGAKYCMNYDDKGRLTSFKAPYGVEVEYNYTERSGISITTETIRGKDNTIVSGKRYQNDLPIAEEDENGSFYYRYDEFKSISTVFDACSHMYANEYDEFGDVIAITRRESGGDGYSQPDVQYHYDDRHLLDTITIANGTVYQFDHDDYNRISKVKLNGTCLFKYEYDNNSNITRQYFGDSDAYFNFQYNDKRLVTEVSYSLSGLRYEYQYDSNNRLTNIYEHRGSETKLVESYTYDAKGTCLKVANETKAITKIFDNNSAEARANIKCDGMSVIQEYDPISRAKGSNPESIIEELCQMHDYSVATFYGDCNAYGADKNYGCYSRAKNPAQLTSSQLTSSIVNDGIINCINTNKKIAYILQGRSFHNNTCETVSFWFKTSSHKNDACLFFAGGGGIYNNKASIAIYEKKNTETNKYYFVVELVTWEGTKYTLISTEDDPNYEHYVLNEWNFISLVFYSRDDGPAYGFEAECRLRVNNQLFKAAWNESRKYCDLTRPDLEMNFGYRLNYDAQTESEIIVDQFSDCKITLVALGNRKHLDDKTITDFYRKTKDYLIDNILLDDADFLAADCSMTNIVKDNSGGTNSFKVFPLENNVFSLDYDPSSRQSVDMPYCFDLRKGSKVDKDRTFNFNKVLKKFAFVADGNRLSYKVPVTESGTFAADFFIDGKNEKQYLFDIKSNNYRISLYRADNNKLVVECNGTPQATSLTASSNAWHAIAISFDKYIQSSSGLTSTSRLIRVVIDNREAVCMFSDIRSVGEVEVMLGRRIDKVSVTQFGESKQTCYPLCGQISNFCYSKSFCNKDTIVGFQNSLKNVSKIKYYDDLGLERREEINKGTTNIYSKETTYRYGKTVPEMETFRFGQGNSGRRLNRSYGFDDMNNVTSIYDRENNVNINYEYDYRGYLIHESNNGLVTDYEYDANGNITRKGNNTFTYSSACPDKLVRFNSENITYDLKTPGNIATFGNWEYVYEGRRLRKATFVVYRASRVEKREITFDYNDKGLRTSKTVRNLRETLNPITGGTDTTVLNEKTTRYEYDCGNLIYEKSNDNTIFYLYDENKELYGYILNGIKYFYVKDFLKNILGVINESGSFVAQYNYDAYGNLISQTGSIYNPFRYKGYYYDSETEMFYCITRYYVPKLCRWLNADNYTFLEKENFNRLNLFAYCGNNPVMCLDPEGHSWWKAMLVAVAAVVVVAGIVALTVATGGSAAPVIAGAIVGAVVSGGLSIFTQFVTTGTVSVEQVIVDMSIGGVMGAFGGSTIGKVGMVFASAAMGGLGSAASDWVADKDVNVGGVIFSAIVGGVFAAFGTGGAQSGKNKYLVNNLKIAKKEYADTLKNGTAKAIRKAAEEVSRRLYYLEQAAKRAIYSSLHFSVISFLVDSIF